MTQLAYRHELIAASALIFAMLPATAFEAQAASPQPVTALSWQGATGHSVTTSAGRVTLTLPADIRAGDTISGTVHAEPAGRTENERQQNLDRLNGYVYDVGGQRVRQAGKVISFVAPAAGIMTLAFNTGSGKTVASTAVRVTSQAGPGPISGLPRIGQAGRPLSIGGSFDGDMANTSVTLSNRPVEIVAESPRAAVFRVPQEQIGASVLRVSEAGRVSEMPLNIVAVKLSAPKTSLRRGESTQLTVAVEGLESAAGPEASSMTLTGSPTIRLEGGNTQQVALSPDGSGRAMFTRQVTAQAPGNFEISGQLMARQAAFNRDGLYSDALDMNGIDSVKELLAEIGGLSDDAQVSLLRGTLKALRQRLSDATDADGRAYLEGKIRIVEKAMDQIGVSH